jgi:CBS domain-containing protein
MTVADLIGPRHRVYTIREDDTVHDAARYLREMHIRSVGVIDAGGKLVGVLSQSDISHQVVAENKCPAWIHVHEIMTRDLVTVAPDCSIEGCQRLLEQHAIHHLPVVALDGEYWGMVSITDLLHVVVGDLQSRADLLESFIFSSR